jgi:hypothetical protein
MSEEDRTLKKEEFLSKFKALEIKLLPDHPYKDVSSTKLRPQ